MTGPLSLENVDAQFCSDWLKGEIRGLLERNAVLTEALELIDATTFDTLDSPLGLVVWHCSKLAREALSGEPTKSGGGG